MKFGRGNKWKEAVMSKTKRNLCPPADKRSEKREKVLIGKKNKHLISYCAIS